MEGDAFTHFNIFTNQSLFPGWQLDPCVAGGDLVPSDCPSSGVRNETGTPVGANAFTMQVSYDFDGDGAPDRQEQYRMMTLSIGNSWTYENKQTNDKFDQQWPYAAPPMIVGGPDGTKTAPFPASIPADKPATITVDMWGGTMCQNSPDCAKASYPVPISVNADPLTDRASWIEPPYGPGSPGEETTTTTVASTSTTSPSPSPLPPTTSSASTTSSSTATSTTANRSTTTSPTGAGIATSTTRRSGSGTLPATGSDPADAIAAAAVALLAGLGLVVTARLRRR